MKEEKIFKKKAHAIKNPHERCTFLVTEFISLSSTANNKAREKTIKKMLISLAGSNCPEAFLYLGKLYYLPNNKYGKAFIAFKNSIKNRYPLAYYEFGYMLENGLGCRKSTEKAVGCYVKAASCGSIDAMYRLGTAYLYKELGLDNITKGIKYLDKATVLGHGEAAYKLSNIYERGIKGHLNSNQQNAFHYLKESANLLYTPALDKLGWCYENGKMGNIKDYSQAFHYYLQASNNGYSQSMYSLAGLIMNNADIDDRLAYEWMLKATRVADPLNKAFYGMGVFYEYGVGVARNLKVALDWYKKAKENDVPDAEQKIKDLEYKINVISNNNNIPSSDIKTNSNINSMENNINSNHTNSHTTQDNRDSLTVTNRESEYYYSPIIMPSPAISVKKNTDKNVIVTMEQLKDMNLTISPDGKVVPLDPSKPSHPFQNYRLSTSTLQHTFSNASSNFDSIILIPPIVEDNVDDNNMKRLSNISSNNDNNMKRLSNISSNNDNNMKRLSNISNNNDNNMKRLSNGSNNNDNNMKRLSNGSNIITKMSPNNVAVQVIEDENKEYTIVPPKRTCYPVISPLMNNNSVKTNHDESFSIMEPAGKTEVELTKLSVNIINKVNVDMEPAKTNSESCRPKIYKIDSQGNIESISGINSPSLNNENINNYSDNYDTLNVPTHDNLYVNELPVPKRLSSFGNVDMNALSQLNSDINKDKNTEKEKENNIIDNEKENSIDHNKENIINNEKENIVENIEKEKENNVDNVDDEKENIAENTIDNEKENIDNVDNYNIVKNEKENIVDNNDDTINNDNINTDIIDNNNNNDIIRINDEIENHDETVNNDNNDDDDEDEDDNDNDNDSDNENDNDNNNENGSLLNVDSNDDPLADVSFDFSYDPIKLNNDNVDILDESTKIDGIKASKSVKTYLPLPRRLESHDNPITNGYLDSEDINPNATVSSSAFVHSFKNLSDQQKFESNTDKYISRQDSERVFQQEVKLSDEERNNNSNNWIDRHPTILSITTDSSEFVFSKLRENSQSSIQSNEFPLSKFRQNSQGSTNTGTFHRFSDISNSATVNYPIHKYGSERSLHQYSSNISSPLIQTSFTPLTPITKEDPYSRTQKYQTNIKSQLSQSPKSIPIVPVDTSKPLPKQPPVPPPRRPLDGYNEDSNNK